MDRLHADPINGIIIWSTGYSNPCNDLGADRRLQLQCTCYRPDEILHVYKRFLNIDKFIFEQI